MSRSDLARLWRFTIGGGVYWDAPVYEQFFRTVRAVNWMLPQRRRIRVLLGDPPFDHSKVRGAADKGYILSMQQQRDAHYAAVVEQEVLRKGRRGLLIAGSDHLLRGITDHGTPPRPNAATRLIQRHPGALYVVDLLVLPPGAQTNPLTRRAAANVARWPRPALATLAGTWLGATTQSAEPWINSAAYLTGTAMDFSGSPTPGAFASFDGGRTWSAPMHVTAASHTGSTIYFQPRVIVAGAATVAVSYLAMVRGRVDVWLARLAAPGAGFGQRQRITARSFDPALGLPGDKEGLWWIGDYQGLATGGGVIHPLWGDTRRGRLEIFTAAVPDR